MKFADAARSKVFEAEIFVSKLQKDEGFSCLVLYPAFLLPLLAEQISAVDPADRHPAATAFDADARPVVRVFADPDARAVTEPADDAAFPRADVQVARLVRQIDRAVFHIRVEARVKGVRLGDGGGRDRFVFRNFRVSGKSRQTGKNNNSC